MLSKIKTNINTNKESIIVVVYNMKRFLVTINMAKSNTLLYKRFVVFKKTLQSHNFCIGLKRIKILRDYHNISDIFVQKLIYSVELHFS